MSVREMENPSCSAEPHGDEIVLKFKVLGSILGPVHVLLDTGTALALVEEIEAAVEVQDERALKQRLAR